MRTYLLLAGLLGCTFGLQAACEYEQSLRAEDFQIGIRLSWSTNMEEDHARFVVEASTDGKTFQDVGTVTGQGSTEAITEYEYLHVFPKERRLHYRLRAIDTDDNFSHSPVVAFEGADSPAFYVAGISSVFSEKEFQVSLDAIAPVPLTYTVRAWNGDLAFYEELLLEPGPNEFTVSLDGYDPAVYKIILNAGRTEEVLTVRKLEAADAPKDVMVRKN